MQWGLTRLALQAARRTWRPKRLQNGGRNPKKSMLKNNGFSTSISQGFGRRFGRAFGRFLEPKMHAESDLKKSARQAKSPVKTNTKSMLEPLQQSIFKQKSMKNCMFFGTSILEAFCKDFGRVLGSQNQ